ncbi:MAG: von Willebrand factor type A domain-containing protein [Gemmatimonadota bacterium]|nr:von Willebrand factor type A domain-containing protein [Gemmatimonadota bacterium]MDE2984459.1 von Willebrand factor type A domain-containing protein [Gemmatimonadota bacterium]
MRYAIRERANTALALALAALVWGGATAAEAQTGSIRGQVTDAVSGEAIPIARISVEGTRLRARADEDGRYTLSGVPVGGVVVVAEFLGYEPERREVTVVRGRPTVVDFELVGVAWRRMTADSIARAAVVGQPVVEAERRQAALRGQVQVAAEQAARVQPLHFAPPHDFNTESYAHIAENDFRLVSASPLSTFSIDVDRASYSNIRRFIQDGERPPVDAVRIEEMINYFPYDWGSVGREHPFSVTTEVWDAPWKREHRLVRIGLHARSIDTADLPPSNLVFLLDVSGSMRPENKLPLLKKAFALLVDQLRAQDRVAIVVYAGAAGLVLPSTPGNKREKILAALDKLQAGGSTAGGAGLELAYATAFEHFMDGGNNRVILATDGDFNVGASSDAEMVRLIEQERDGGTFLTVMGFGTGNLKDSKMEQIADHGNGNFHYVDGLLEARKVLVEEMGGTLFTLAKDVKLQIEFNPASVAGYRLIGYENRLLADEDFNDDTKDAGELGAGHTVTALYEVVPVGVAVPREEVDDLRYQPQPDDLPASEFADEMMYVKVRYKDPDGTKSRLLEQAVAERSGAPSVDFRFATAVAGFGMLLRDSKHAGDLTLGDVVGLAEKGKGDDPRGYRGEFIRLVEATRDLGLLRGEGAGSR